MILPSIMFGKLTEEKNTILFCGIVFLAFALRAKFVVSKKKYIETKKFKPFGVELIITALIEFLVGCFCIYFY